MQERHRSKHKSGGSKVCKTYEVRKCFVNSKTENAVFS